MVEAVCAAREFLHPTVKFTVVTIAALLGCVLLYEGVIKRLGRGGVLFGLKHQPKSGLF